MRSVIATLPAVSSPSSGSQGVAISPDGRYVVYEAGGRLHLRPLDQVESRPLAGTDGGVQPAFSPDSESVAFFVPEERAIKRIPVGGGQAAVIATTDGSEPRGLSWGSDGAVVFATVRGAGLWRVPALGGDPERLTSTADGRDIAHMWPSVLPDAGGVLFNASRGVGSPLIALVSLDTREVTYLTAAGARPVYSPTGHIVYSAGGGLRAVGFDRARLAITGDAPGPVVDSVRTGNDGYALFDVAGDGSLTYVPGASVAEPQTLAWVDREGREEPLSVPKRGYRLVRVSPSGTRIVAQLDAGGPPTVWVTDVSRPAWSRVAGSGHRSGDWFPHWTPDERRIVFSSGFGDTPSLFWAPADGTGRSDKLLTIENNAFLASGEWAPDGSLIFTYGTPATPGVGLLSMREGSGNERSWSAMTGPDVRASNAIVSPDGDWIAYQAAISGRCEVYIERFPGLGDRRLVSTEPGGQKPVWSASGGELFYQRLSDGAMMAVSVQASPTLTIGIPQELFEAPNRNLCTARTWDLAPDGRFLIIKDAADAGVESPQEIVYFQNWHEELKRLVPAQ